MDILNSIEKLQKKPEAARKRILAATLVVIMSIIVVIWLTTFDLEVKGEEIKKAAAPFNFIKQDFSDFYGYFKNIRQNIK